MNIEETLKERGDRYGSFAHHAEISQKLQDVLRAESGWSRQAPDQKQALTTICDKIARMLNGDPTYRDNWHDIVGYAKLVDDRMAADSSAEATPPPQFSEWQGGICPCSSDTVVSVLFRDGEQVTSMAGHFLWTHGCRREIIGWRYAS